MRRCTVAVAALASVAMLVGACGGTQKPDASDKSPSAVNTDIAPPPPTAAQTFAGQSLTPADIETFTKTVNSAIATGDEKKFLTVFDPTQKDLIAQQRTWFRNIRTVPMSVRKVYLVEAHDDMDSSGKAALSADFGFEHQIKGADPAPLAEWYAFKFRKLGARLRVVGVGGASADASGSEKFSRYYRQAWDDGPLAVVQGRKSIVLGQRSDMGAMRSMVGGLDAAVQAQLGRFKNAGYAVPASVSTRKWVFTLPTREVDNFFDYFGGDVDRNEANFEAFAAPVFASDLVIGDLKTDEAAVTSRIVVNRRILGDGYLPTTIRHEMTHALEQTWVKEGYGSAPTWAVEGFAVYMSDASDRASRHSAGVSRLRAQQDLPRSSKFYLGSDAQIDGNYGAGLVAIEYLAHLRGEKGLIKVMQRLDTNSDSEAEQFRAVLGMSTKQFARKAAAWAS